MGLRRECHDLTPVVMGSLRLLLGEKSGVGSDTETERGNSGDRGQWFRSDGGSGGVARSSCVCF